MSADRELSSIEEVAAGWMVERDRGLSPARNRELGSWLAADVRHAATFHALEETWALLGEAPGTATDFEPAFSARPRRVWLPATLAAAATIAFATLGWWRSISHGPTDPAGPYAVTSTTEIGALREVALPDGSRIQLNTDSVVDVRYTAAERRVTLARGEAHFSVAKNPERPFIVTVAGVDVRVVGTVFNIRLRPESVDVLVTEGKVRVAPPVAAAPGPETATEELGQAELTAGQKLSIGLSAPSAPVTTRAELSINEIKQALAWKARRLDFDASPLRDIVAEMNRYNRHRLVIVDPRLNEQRFGGSFPAGDHATIVRMLEANFGIVAERVGDETRLRRKGP